MLMRPGDGFEFPCYLRDNHYKIKPLKVMSVLVGTRQPRCLVQGHSAKPALGDIPRIPKEHKRSNQLLLQKEQEKSVLLKWGKGCCLFSDFNLQKSKKENQKIKQWED